MEQPGGALVAITSAARPTEPASGFVIRTRPGAGGTVAEVLTAAHVVHELAEDGSAGLRVEGRPAALVVDLEARGVDLAVLEVAGLARPRPWTLGRGQAGERVRLDGVDRSSGRPVTGACRGTLARASAGEGRGSGWTGWLVQLEEGTLTRELHGAAVIGEESGQVVGVVCAGPAGDPRGPAHAVAIELLAEHWRDAPQRSPRPEGPEPLVDERLAALSLDEARRQAAADFERAYLERRRARAGSAAVARKGGRAANARAGTQPMMGLDFTPTALGRPFRWVAGGRFWMGSSTDPAHPAYDADADPDELDARWVTVSPFWIAESPAVNADFLTYRRAVRGGEDPMARLELTRRRGARFDGDDQFLVCVSWHEACAYARFWTETAPLPFGLVYRLPTEAEWELAARGPCLDSRSRGRRYPWGDEPPTHVHARFGQDWQSGRPGSPGEHPLGRSLPCGADDLAGGVWEWCLDGWRGSYREVDAGTVDPCQRAPAGAPRVLRGGSWCAERRELRAAARHLSLPDRRSVDLGFRLVCGAPREALAGG
ncbi:MAG TPA: SUMF1/EgtB/PvdO family nonheme iron enzyme [Kofleriaceae bacterium]|nr:SUMF1/EgtB/PvdO family nonheme iron enzyme [Kofleriaceae bacterium]